MNLRPYQQRAIDEVLTAFESVNGVFLTLPTGAGKTVCFSALAGRWVDAGQKVLILAHRVELLDQAADKLAAFGLKAGIIQGPRNTDPTAAVQVASVDTLGRRDLPWMPAYIIVDEAHLSAANRFKRVLARYPEAKRLLVSATPFRFDGKGFRDFADRLIIGSSINELIEAGHLVRPRYLTGELPPGLDKIHTTAGDFNGAELEKAVNVRALRADVVSTFAKHAADRKAVVFACSVAHSQALAAEFCAAGFRAEHLDGSQDAKTRAGILARLESGETQIVTNVNVLCEGWDCPSIGAVVLARPTKSPALYIQQVGRVLRPSPGKVDGLILDHGGNFHRHGNIQNPRSYTLDGIEREKREPKKDPVCMRCGRMVGGNGRCAWCYQPQITRIEYISGELFTPREHPQAAAVIEEYQRLLTIAARKRTQAGKPYSRGWAFYKLIERGYSLELLIDILGASEVPYSLRQELEGRG